MVSKADIAAGLLLRIYRQARRAQAAAGLTPPNFDPLLIATELEEIGRLLGADFPALNAEIDDYFERTRRHLDSVLEAAQDQQKVIRNPRWHLGEQKANDGE